jgi:hypothetical protein
MPRYHSLVLLTALLFISSAVAQDKKPPADKDGWKDLFDGKSLDGWKAAKFTNTGEVRVKDGMIVMERGDRMTGVTYTRGDFPTIDYEVTLEGKRVDGRDFFATTTFPVGKSHCSLVVGGWGGRVVGLSSLNGMDASENDTRSEKAFEKDRWYRFRIRVTPRWIEAWIDKDKVVDVNIEDRQIKTRIECIPNHPFGVATWDTKGAVRGLRVRLLTEVEKKAARDRPNPDGER